MEAKRHNLSPTMKRALLALADGRTIYWWMRGNQSGTHGPAGVNARTMRALERKGLVSSKLTEGTEQEPAGPFGSTRWGWITIEFCERSYKLTPAGLEALER